MLYVLLAIYVALVIGIVVNFILKSIESDRIYDEEIKKIYRGEK